MASYTYPLIELEATYPLLRALGTPYIRMMYIGATPQTIDTEPDLTPEQRARLIRASN